VAFSAKDNIVRLYRKIFCRGGYGIHSPFVFDLIINVIEERRQYYCYEKLHEALYQIKHDKRKVFLNGATVTMAKAARDNCLTENELRLLFRLANRFRPQTILTAGSDFGTTAMYMTAFSSSTQCIAIEPEQSVAAAARHFIKRFTQTQVEIVEDTFSNFYLPDNKKIDMLMWGNSAKEHFDIDVLERLLPFLRESSVLIIKDIRNGDIWKTVCTHPKVSVTIDLYNLGIVFFDPKLHRRTYKCVI